MLNRRIKSILGHLARFQIEQKFSKVVNEFYYKTKNKNLYYKIHFFRQNFKIFWKKKSMLTLIV